MRSVCVFCGSNLGSTPAYGEAAAAMGRALAQRGLRLVYGGAAIGLMGVVADAALAAGGEVVGVIPAALVAREIAHPGLTELRTVDSMHERKMLMSELSDAFVAMPGGAGTLEELFEIWTWGQLGHHAKPIGILNVAGFFDPLLAFIARQAEQGFMRPEHRDMLAVENDPVRLLAKFNSYQPPRVEKWISRGEQ